MKLDRLPEIVEAVNVKAGTEMLCYVDGEYQWRHAEDSWNLGAADAFDAANACVVEMLRRLTKNGAWVTVQDDRITINSESIPEYDGVGFPGDLLNALYDAFTAHPEWFKEPTNG